MNKITTIITSSASECLAKKHDHKNIIAINSPMTAGVINGKLVLKSIKHEKNGTKS